MIASPPPIYRYVVTAPYIAAFRSGFHGQCMAPADHVVCVNLSKSAAALLTRPLLCTIEVRGTTTTGSYKQIAYRLTHSPFAIKRFKVC